MSDERATPPADPIEGRQGLTIGVVVLAALVIALLVGFLVAALFLGGFFNAPAGPTREPAVLARMAPGALAEAPGLAYQLSVEVNEAGGLQGLASSGLIDLRAKRFSGTADGGRAASMLMFGGPTRGSVVLADGLFVQTEGGPWEAVPIENATQLQAFTDPDAIGRAVAAAIEGAEIDPGIRTESCGSAACQVVNLIVPPQAASAFIGELLGQEVPPPGDLLPIEAELWLDPETGFPTHVVVQGLAGGTTTRIDLDLERLDPQPAIAPPIP